MSHYVHFRLKRYALPVLSIALALLIRLALEPALQGHFVYSFFYIAIILTAWTSGTTETFVAVLLGFVAAEWFLVEPVRSFAIVGAQGWVGAAVYFFIGLTIVWFMKSNQSQQLLALASAIHARRRQQELEEQLRRAQCLEQHLELLNAIVEAAPSALISFSPEGVIKTWNGAAQNLFGYSAQEAVGQPLALLMPSEDKWLRQDLLSGISGEGTAEPWEARLAHKDGSVVMAWLTLSPLKTPTGKPLGASVLARSSAG